MSRDEYPSRETLLELPISVNSFLVLRQYVFTHHDMELYCKLLSDYLGQLPVADLIYILAAAQIVLDDVEYEELVQLIFVY